MLLSESTVTGTGKKGYRLETNLLKKYSIRTLAIPISFRGLNMLYKKFFYDILDTCERLNDRDLLPNWKGQEERRLPRLERALLRTKDLL